MMRARRKIRPMGRPTFSPSFLVEVVDEGVVVVLVVVRMNVGPDSSLGWLGLERERERLA